MTNHYPKRGALFFSKDSTVSTPFRILFLLFIILGIYYPTIFGQFNSVDDLYRVNNLLNRQYFDFYKLFIAGHGSYYFRPLVASSFYLDQILFSCRSEIMHLENILIHCLNALLVYWTAEKLFKTDDEKEQIMLPLVTALFFALNPICTEPVNWISGRYDLGATFFVLLSFNILIRNTENFKWWKEILAVFFILIGLLSKETAAGAIIVLGIGAFWRGSPLFVSGWGHRLKRYVPAGTAFLIYLWMRNGLEVAKDSGLTAAVKGAHTATGISYWLKIRAMITALGFYLKKAVWPFPLNFGIFEIHRLVYFSLGAIALIVLIWILFQNKGKVRFFILWCIVFVSPALIVAANHMAWTLLAERYLYTSMAGVSLGIGIVLIRIQEKTRISMLVMGCLLLFFGWQTTMRNMTWQNNITLFADVVKKSPKFAPGHNEYGIALLAAGKIEKAKQQFEMASKLSGSTSYQAVPSINTQITKDPGALVKAIEKSLQTKGLSRERRIELLKKLAQSLDKQLLEITDEAEKKNILKKNQKTQQRLYRETKNPFHLYRAGQLHLALGEKELARSCFKTVCNNSHAYYTPAACKLSRKLVEER